MRKLPDNYYDLTIADPPLGKKEDGRRNRSSFRRFEEGRKVYIKDGAYTRKSWDEFPASAEYFRQLFRISKHQIIWGIPNFDFNPGQGRIVWNKLNGTAHNTTERLPIVASMTELRSLITYGEA